MKRKILLIISIVALLVVTATMLFACSSGTPYEKMAAYYEENKANVKKCESTLDALMGTLKKSSFAASITLERSYYNTADDNIAFKGTKDSAGYDFNEKERGNKWMKSAIDYSFKYKAGDYEIVAKVRKPLAYDDYSAKNKGEVIATYTYKKIGDAPAVCTGGAEEVVTEYCYTMLYDVIFGTFTSDEFLESYAFEATKGFRFVTNMMQYQTARAFKYAADGTIDSSAVVAYTENKDKTVYTDVEEGVANGKLSDAYEAKMRGDDISYWANYGEDISYNLYKVATIKNDRVTMTYKKKANQVQSFEYYGEKVLPFYTKKSDFKTYNVLKAVVADYTHFVVNFEYKSVTIA